MTNEKKKIIARKKKIEFRQAFRFFIDTSSEFWRLIAWTKNKNHKSRKVFQIFALTRRNATDVVLEKIEDFSFKIEMLHQHFFLTRQRRILMICKRSIITLSSRNWRQTFKKTKSSKSSNVANWTTFQNLTTFQTKFWKFFARRSCSR
jgi:uncharacterized protein with NAD-binding domain and iron-sulfur cluster